MLAGVPSTLQGAAELHLHLEGAIRPEAWLRLIRRHEPGTSLTLDDLRKRLRFTDMAGFFETWMQVLYTLRDPEDYRQAAYECGIWLAESNAVYAELHTSIAGAHWAGRLNGNEAIPAIAEGLNAAQAEGGPRWRLIVDVIRELCAVDAGHIGLELALNNRAHGVVAVGLGGEEARHSTELARDLFAAAKAGGLHVTAHAGEGAGPESIWKALELGAERLGHAVRASEDPVLMEHLLRHQVHLEMCPTSNVRTGAVASLAEHPVADFLRRGLNVSVNTDDPALFGTNLAGELSAVQRTFSLTEAEMARLRDNALGAAFG
ncbi:MAG TPA: adenosine deaminase [Armatimonadota bacterium]|jgi:adenosine deaminase/aminodeoxyfutalosine deaminase